MRTERPDSHERAAVPLPAWKRRAFDLLKKPFFGRFQRPWRFPEGVERADYETFEVRNHHGGRLQGLLRQTNVAPARGIVLLAHPMGLAAKGFFIKYGHVALFNEAGYHCVMFDFNGFGESESTSFEYPQDLLAVAVWARRRFRDLPLAVVGKSFGAMRALEAGSDPDSPFSVIVAEAVAASLPEFWRQYPLPYAVLRTLQIANPGGERKLRPEAQIRLFPPGRQVLLIHSREDRLTPPEQGDKLAAAAPAHIGLERLVVERGEHTHVLRDSREAYVGAVLPFLERHLPTVVR